MRIITLLILTLFMVYPAFAKEVTPEEKLGSFLLITPDVSGLSEDVQRNLDPRNYNYQLTTGGKSIYIKPGQANEVTAGDVCLKIYNKIYNSTLERCDLKVEENKLFELKLSTVVPHWKPELFKVDLGVKPKIRVFTENDIVFWVFSPYMYLENMDVLPLNKINIAAHVFSGSYKMNISHHGYSFKFRATEGKVQQLDFTPQNDIRSTIEISFLDTPAKYPFMEGNYVVLKWGEPSPKFKFKTLAPFSMNTNYKQFGLNKMSEKSPTINFYQLSKYIGSQAFKVFPESGNNKGLQIVVNETERVLDVKPGQMIKLDIETVNVNDYESGVEGDFQLYNIRGDSSTKETLERIEPFHLGHGTFKNVRRKTQSSMHLLPKASYFLEFTITDDFGHTSLQDEIRLDL